MGGVSVSSSTSSANSVTTCCKHELPKYACDSWLWNRFNITKNTLSDTWIGPESGGSLSFELKIPDLVDDGENNNNNQTEEKEKSSSSSSLPVECSSLKFVRFAAKCVDGVREGDSIRLKIEILVEVESEIEKEKKKRKR